MVRGRIILSCAALLLFLCAAANAQDGCHFPDAIYVTSDADTIFVNHDQADMNCCSTLAISIVQDGFTVDFYEDETGDLCVCMCCFNLEYEGHGFGPGHYLVRIWKASDPGYDFIGQGEVDVEGNGAGPVIGLAAKGDCMAPQDVPNETPGVRAKTWGGLRSLYR